MCGDGVIDPDEECDDGNRKNEDTCTNACTYPLCGDTFIQMDEECDDGNMMDNDACTANCKKASCGDGFVQKDVEECDDGAKNADANSCKSDCTSNVCGDGQAHVGVEGCDDGNKTDDDGCSNACIVARYVFVSSAMYNGNLGGVSGGNGKCKSLADAADAITELKGKKWRVWLSDGANNPGDDILDFEGWYRLPNGAPVVNGATGFFNGALSVGIDRDEKNMLQMDVDVWTGTKTDGEAHATNLCAAWLSSDKRSFGLQGSSSAIDSNWTDSISTSCNSTKGHIYCVQIPG